MRDSGTKRRLALGCALFAWAFGGLAGAAEVVSPPGEAVSQDANPSQTGVASEAALGPLRIAWAKRFPGPVNQPLVANGQLFVNVANSNGSGSYGSTVRALDPVSGEQLWSAAHDHVYFTSRMATDSGVVVAQGPTYGEPLRAFDSATGAELWARSPDPAVWSGSVLAADGVVYASRNSSTVGTGRITAYGIRSGNELWSSQSTGIDADDRTSIALDSDRVYLADECGGAAAINRGNGAVTWARGGNSSCFAGDAVVAGGVVFSGRGYTYDAATGTPRAPVAGLPGAVIGTVGVGDSAASQASDVSGWPLVGGPPAWSHLQAETDDRLEPLVVGETAYVARNYYFDSSAELIGYGVNSGDELLRMDLPYPEYVQVGGTTPGLTAAAGRLYVAQGLTLVALEPLLEPPPEGIDLTVTPQDVLASSNVELSALVGGALPQVGRRVTFEGNEHPFGDRNDWSTSSTTLEDGTARASYTLRRNTRFTAAIPSAQSQPITAYAYPLVRLRIRPGGPHRVRAITTVERLPGSVLRNRWVYAYYARNGRRFVRKSRARIELSGNRPPRASPIVRLPRDVGRKDVIAVCVQGLPEDGYGRDIGLPGQCGRRAVVLPAARQRAPRVLSRASLPARAAARGKSRQPAENPK